MPVYILFQWLQHPGMSHAANIANWIEPSLATIHNTVKLFGFASFLVPA